LATLATGPFWTDHTQDGVAYSVKHVQPTFVDYAIPAIAPTARRPGRAAMTVKVRIVYSHHCFTQALARVANAGKEQHYNCTKRPNEQRVFCAIRWHESLALPAIVAGIKNCYFTRHHNYFVWRNPTDPGLDEYFVYFSVTRRSGYVEIEIESAYSRADGNEAKAGAQKVSMNTLIVNAANGRATRRPPG
jgi:hypothetical protein